MLQPAREQQSVGGLDVLVNLLKKSSRMTEKTIIEALEDNEPELAEQVKKRMFVFENVALLDDKSIQRILREVEVKDLSLALKATPENVKDSILRNMSTRASAMLREDMEATGPVRLRQEDEEDGEEREEQVEADRQPMAGEQGQFLQERATDAVHVVFRRLWRMRIRIAV